MIDFTYVEGDSIPFDPSVHHPLYDYFLPIWQKNRDAREGVESIKRTRTKEDLERSERYLPRLSGHRNDSEYQEYLERASWYGATGRTVADFLGRIFRKDLTYAITRIDGGEDVSSEDDLYDRTMEILDNAASDGRPVTVLARQIADEIFTVNRVGVFEDFPKMLDDEGAIRRMTQLEFERSGLASKTAIYRTESIINWGVEVIENEYVPIYYVLLEAYEHPTDNPLRPETRRQYRLLYLDGSTGSPIYRQAILRESEDTRGKNTPEHKFVVHAIITPLRNGALMDRIPFWVLTGGAIGVGDVDLPLLDDLVEVNIGHFRNSADFENELHKLAVKTAIFPGWDEDNLGVPTLGGALSVPPESEPFYLEASSTSGIKEEMQAKEARMAALGAELLSGRGRYVQSAETASVQISGEISVVEAVAKLLGASLSLIMSFKLEWGGTGAEVSIAVNDDLLEDGLSVEDLTKYMQMTQAGHMSFHTFFYQLSKRDIYPEDWSMEKEVEAIIEDRERFGMSGDVADELAAMIAALEARLNGGDEDEPDEDEPDEPPPPQETEE